MAKKLLQVVTSAYRGTLEEQDDTVLWLVQAMKGAGADLHVLLSGNAVGYLVRGQDASGLAFGEKTQKHPPKLDEDLARMIAKGIAVHFVAEDLAERGIGAPLLPGASAVARADLPALFERYDQVWQW